MTTASALDSRLNAVRDLGRLDPALVQKFGAFLTAAPDEQVFRVNPILWGKRYGVPERDAIDLFLYATHAGLLDMSWGVLCPTCAGFITSADGIRSLGKARRCSFCEVEVQGVLDDNIEVSFTASPQVRPVRLLDPEAMKPGDEFVAYFSTSVQVGSFTVEDMNKRVRARVMLAAGASQLIEADLPPGRYAVLAPQQHAVAHLTVRPGAGGHTAEIDLLAGDFVPNAVTLGPGPAKIKLANRTRGPARMLLYDGVTPAPEDRGDVVCPHPVMHPYLSGKLLLTTQVFRDLFRADSVPGDAGIALKSLSLLFTDLKGSTEMYERIGDLKAFDLVSKHFELLRSLVRRRGGQDHRRRGDGQLQRARGRARRRRRHEPRDRPHRRRAGAEDRHPRRPVHRRTVQRPARLLRPDREHRGARAGHRARRRDRLHRPGARGQGLGGRAARGRAPQGRGRRRRGPSPALTAAAPGLGWRVRPVWSTIPAA